MDQSLRFLILEDEPTDAQLMQSTLQSEYPGAVWKRVETREGFLDALEQFRPDLILADYTLAAFNGESALRLVKERKPDIPFILVSGTMGEEFAIDMVKSGATDYVLKQRPSRLVPAVERALKEVTAHREHQRALTRLSASESQYQSLVESATDVIFTLSAEGTFTSLNPAFEWITGWKPEEWINKRFLDLIHPDDAVSALEIFSRTLRGAKSLPIELRILSKSSQYLVGEITFTLWDKERAQSEILGIGRDITERKRSEATIREQAALLDIVPNAIVVRDLDDHITLWNAGAERLYGWTSGEVIGKPPFEILYRDNAEVYAVAKQVLFETGIWHGELHQLTQSGKPITVESRWMLLRNSAGEPDAILIVNSDITEKKKLEQQFLRAQRMESIGTLAGGIAHDLNNVLSPILLSVQILQRHITNELSQRMLSTLEASAKRAADLVKQVLTFARGIEGERVEIQVRHLVGEIEKIVNDTFPKSIQIQTAIPKDLWTLSGDATQLHQILLNLCVNARDAMPHGGLLKIRAENLNLDKHFATMYADAMPGPYILLEVSDTGFGIPPSIQQKIFEPFFTTKDIGKGTGLGLSTVQAIVKSHNGFIDVLSEVGRGAKFRIYIPAIPASESKQAEHSDEELPLGNGELILVVDDEVSIREITKETLETYGYRVLTASEGTEAIALYAQQFSNIHVVITDVLMPIMDGLSTIRALQKMNPEIKIIAASGLTLNKGLIDTSNLNVETFLSKPFTAEKLLKTLASVLRPSPS